MLRMATSRRPGRRPLLIAALSVALAACRATITVPAEEAVPGESRPVILVDHGRHASLVLARADASLVRYVYGDWRWYAEADTGALRVFPTLFLRTQGALGRREFAGAPEPATIRRASRVTIEKIHVLPASAARIDALAERLDARFDAGRDTLLYNALYDLEFVHDPRPYVLAYNSNHVVAEWLRELGVEVRGNPVFGRWRLAD